MKPVAFGKYTLLKRIARGGMADLFLARWTSVAGVERLVAVKLVSTRFTGDKHLTAMFSDEARIAAMLDHPNIGQVFEVGEVEGQYYLALEYIYGTDLHRIIDAARASGHQTLPLGFSVNIAAKVCSALHYAHKARDLDGKPLDIVHRDVSPSNVMVTYHGNVKLVDFGIAKAANRIALTKPGFIKGKIQYLTPEQISGRPVDGRSDVFSLGACLWEATVGRQLFRGNNELQIVEAISSHRVPNPSSLVDGYPPELEQIVLCALAQKPEDRFATARDMQVALEQFSRNHRLLLSELETAAFLRQVFKREIDAWETAQRNGRSLIEHLLATASDDDDDDAPLSGSDHIKTLMPESVRRQTPARRSARDRRDSSPAAIEDTRLPRSTGGAGKSENSKPAKRDVAFAKGQVSAKGQAFAKGQLVDASDRHPHTIKNASTLSPPSSASASEPQGGKKTVFFAGTGNTSTGIPTTNAQDTPNVPRKTKLFGTGAHPRIKKRPSEPHRISDEKQIAVTPDGSAQATTKETDGNTSLEDSAPTIAPLPTNELNQKNEPTPIQDDADSVSSGQSDSEVDFESYASETIAPHADGRKRRPRTGDWAQQSVAMRRPGTHPYFKDSQQNSAVTLRRRPARRNNPIPIVLGLVVLVLMLASALTFWLTRHNDAPAEITTTARPKASNAVSAKHRSEERAIQITSTPSGATVFSSVTGLSLGKTPLRLVLSAIEGQRLEIHHNGYKTAEFTANGAETTHHTVLELDSSPKLSTDAQP